MGAGVGNEKGGCEENRSDHIELRQQPALAGSSLQAKRAAAEGREVNSLDRRTPQDSTEFGRRRHTTFEETSKRLSTAGVSMLLQLGQIFCARLDVSPISALRAGDRCRAISALKFAVFSFLTSRLAPLRARCARLLQLGQMARRRTSGRDGSRRKWRIPFV